MTITDAIDIVEARVLTESRHEYFNVHPTERLRGVGVITIRRCDVVRVGDRRVVEIIDFQHARVSANSIAGEIT